VAAGTAATDRSNAQGLAIAGGASGGT
jgi:hypothetical protein